MNPLDHWLFLLLNAEPGTPHAVIAVFQLVSSSLLTALVMSLAIISLWQRQRRPALLCGLAAMLVAAAAVWLIRSALPLPRPAALGLGVQWLAQNASRPGFPSAHTTAAFAFASALLLARWRGAAAIAFLVAALIGYSRIFLGMHFPSQVLAGALLGTALSLSLLPLDTAVAHRIDKFRNLRQGQVAR